MTNIKLYQVILETIQSFKPETVIASNKAARVRRERETTEESLALDTVETPLSTHQRRF
jgi:hypothetical protein